MTLPREFSAASRSALGLLGLLLVGCGSGAALEPIERCTGSECDAGACTVGAETYKNGTTGIPAADACNTCSCQDGQLSCTERACGAGNPCEDNMGAASSDPAEAPMMHIDDCNSCWCADGQMVCTDAYCPSTCEQDGVVYQDGALVGSADECGNTCTCIDGSIACTMIACPSGCFYEGALYDAGTSFPAGDGCNTCSCSGSDVVCTEAACHQTGGACFSDFECADGELCARPAGSCGAEGKCAPKPESCVEVFAPVCGCDGVTYTAGECSAQTQGTSVAYFGECGTQAISCFTNDTCGQNEYCDSPQGFCSVTVPAAPGAAYPPPGGGAALLAPPPPLGSCRPRPSICTKQSNPVCGCDGASYGNPCMAAAAGVSIIAAGRCP